MSIQWGATGISSMMQHRVLDNDAAPTEVLTSGIPFDIEVRWEVPPVLAGLIGPGDNFRLRAYCESIGPGQEELIGETNVGGVVGQTPYQTKIHVTKKLLGEEELFGGVPVSGVYNIVVVLQHQNAGISTVYSGYSDDDPLLMFKAP